VGVEEFPSLLTPRNKWNFELQTPRTSFNELSSTVLEFKTKNKSAVHFMLNHNLTN